MTKNSRSDRMTPAEIENALKSMVCLVDTREQDTPRFRARIKQIDCPVEREKLDFGDYSAKMIINGEWRQMPVTVERKMDFGELAQCFCKGRARFSREFDRAKAANAKVYLLVENQSWEDAYRGNYRSEMKPKAFVASLLAWLARYDCQIIFCNEHTSGKLIHDILYRECREYLERMMLDA